MQCLYQVQKYHGANRTSIISTCSRTVEQSRKTIRLLIFNTSSPQTSKEAIRGISNYHVAVTNNINSYTKSVCLLSTELTPYVGILKKRSKFKN